jgi:solute carrier family 25 (mitochondrial dicarboxylate transporter), member 10
MPAYVDADRMTNTAPKPQKQPFWVGGLGASLAVLFTHPLDQTKYRMQTMPKPPNMLRTMRMFASRDGIVSLWSGLSASILRQSTYSTARFGLYQHFANEARQRTGQQKLSLGSEIICAGTAGGLAGLIGNPTEVALVRMCADGARPVSQQFGYRHCFDALYRVGSEEGLKTFARGLGPNVVRSVLMNVGQIATYGVAKQAILDGTGMRDGLPVHFAASLAGGTVATTICAPADVLKSRIQNAKGGSLLMIMKDGWIRDGPLFLMRGWTPAWLRLAPNTVLTFVFMEQIMKGVRWYREKGISSTLAERAEIS